MSDGGWWFSKLFWRVWVCDYTSYGYLPVFCGDYEGARKFVHLVGPFYWHASSVRLEPQSQRAEEK